MGALLQLIFRVQSLWGLITFDTLVQLSAGARSHQPAHFPKELAPLSASKLPPSFFPSTFPLAFPPLQSIFAAAQRSHFPILPKIYNKVRLEMEDTLCGPGCG